MDKQDQDGAPGIPRPETSLRPEPEPDDGDDELVEGHVSTQRLAAILGVASTVAVFAAISFFSIGMVLGASIGPGMGGFVANFEEVTYDGGDAKIYPVLDEHPACEGAPQLEVDLQGPSTLDGYVSFYKDLPLPADFGTDDAGNDRDIARVSVVADAPPDGIEVDDLGLRLTALKADDVQLGQTDIREFGPNDYDDDGLENASFAESGQGVLDLDDPDATPVNVPEYGISSGLFNLPNGGTAVAHQVTLSQIQLNDIDLFVAIGSETEFEQNSPVVESAVDPNDRDCESLFDST